MQTNFLLGSLRMTEEARLALRRVPYDLLARHAINDHGIISPRQRKVNEVSMKTIGPIKSRYRADPTDPRTKYVVIVTDDTWASTLVDLE